MEPLEVPSETLLQLADALEAGHVRGPLTKFGLRAFTTSASAVRSLEALRQTAGSEAALAAMCRLVVAERAATMARAPRVELVWTGPERAGASSRDTKVVVAELFARARRSVLVSSYSLSGGATLFAPLAARMAEIPALRVRMFFDLTVGDDGMSGPRTREAHEARFVQRFRKWHWRGARVPEVFHDPRTIDDDRISFHAKCIVIDEEIAFVTSANTSVVAQQENIEAGVLIEDRLFALALGKQFDDLVTAGLLVPVQGLAALR
ncbi:DISARM system phospholipase D-like protein DrmC [Sorangium sp. So ce1036]|uniref:DISARM system phospholipase D-like protein DrmC n=1 Tax=Sorangium sp. So ce1036 TaxID=3133328 RepID=UPI003F11B7A3